MNSTTANSFHGLDLHQRRGQLTALLSLLLLTLLPYANTFTDSGFFYDNQGVILEDSRIHSLTAENLRLIFTGEYWWNRGSGSGVYRPVTTLSYLFNYAVLGNGSDAAGYHVLNWLLHAGNAILVFFLATALFREFPLAFFTAAIFAVHPLNVEAVTNIVGRADLLATLALLAGLHCYMRSRIVAAGKRLLWHSALMCCWLLGLFAKESAVVLPGILFLHDITFCRQLGQDVHSGRLISAFRRLRPSGYLALAPPLLIFWLVRKSVFAGLTPAWHDFLDNPLVAAGFWQARLTAIKVIGRYIALLCWPATLSIDYSYNQIPLVQWPFVTWEDWQSAAALLVIAGIIWLGLRNYRNNNPLFFMIFLFFGTLLPVANLLPRPGASPWETESWLIGTLMAERLMYLPSIGFAGFLVIAIAWSTDPLRLKMQTLPAFASIPSRLLTTILLGLLVAGLSIRTFQRNQDWQNEVVFWRKAVQASPNSFRTHLLLASTLYHTDPGRTNIDTVIAEAEKALAITDRYEPLLVSLGIYYRDKGDLLNPDISPETQSRSPGTPWYEKSVNILSRAAVFDQQTVNVEHRAREIRRGQNPEGIADVGNTDTYYNLGLSLSRLGRHEEALEAYRYLCHLFPFDHRPYREMAAIFQFRQDVQQETLNLHTLVLLNDQDPSNMNRLATLYIQAGLRQCVRENGQGQALLDYSCPAVHTDVCRANVSLVETLVGAKQTDVAIEIARGSARVFGCDPGSYAHLLHWEPDNPAGSRRDFGKLVN